MLREARLIANEEVLKLRDQTDQSLSKRRLEIEEAEKRLAQREKLNQPPIGKSGPGREKPPGATTPASPEDRYFRIRAGGGKPALRSSEEELSRVARLTEADARALLLKGVEEESLRDATTLSRRILEGAKLKAEEEARRILAIALQRYAGEYTFETTTATITLSNEEIKGRIIGREGRNIRAFEASQA